MSEDYNSSVYTAEYIRSKVLKQIGFVLQLMGKQLRNYNFVDINFCTNDIRDKYREMNYELSIVVNNEDILAANSLNSEQKFAHD